MSGVSEDFCAHCNGYNSATELKSRKDLVRISKLKKCLKAIYETYPHRKDMSFVKWLKIAQSFYKFDEESKTLSSNALGPDKIKMWNGLSSLEAEIKILKLIAFKEYDHWKRTGRNLAWFKWIHEECDEKVIFET
jgi:hypothetical protein